MYLRQPLNDDTACATYLPGCKTHGTFAVVWRMGYERRHNRALRFASDDAFVEAPVRDIPPAPEQQTAIVAANRIGRPLAGVA